jgi:lipopolysaccharide/colanic/teichoic acid biosynthesis glycosyltransferase
LFIVVGDLAAWSAAFLVIMFLFPQHIQSVEVQRSVVLAGMTVLAFNASHGLYPGYRIHDHELLRRRTLATLQAAVLAAFAAQLLPEGPHLLVPVLGILGLGLMLQPGMCWVARRLCRKMGIWGERAAIIGSRHHVLGLVKYFGDHWTYGIRPEPYPTEAAPQVSTIKPALALVADDKGSFVADLSALRQQFSEVVLLSDTPCLKVSGVQPVDVQGEIGVRLAGGRDFAGSAAIRRSLDLAIAVTALVMVAPFLLFASCLIYLIDPGPVLFKQTREGVAGKQVQVLKLRTMYRNAEQRLETLFRDDPAKKAEWSKHFKLKHDPRILPVIGQALRSTSFDELPQLLNIIAGQMAIVGPRPFPEYHLLAMDRDFRVKRRSVVPGLTGLWQISGRSSADLKLTQQLDDFYIDNRSLWFDWHIVLNTISAVFKRDGAY